MLERPVFANDQKQIESRGLNRLYFSPLEAVHVKRVQEICSSWQCHRYGCWGGSRRRVHPVVAALTKDLLTPLIAAIVGKPDFSAIQFTVNGSVFALGDFINAVGSFLLIAASVYFLVIVPINAATAEGSRLIQKVIPKELRGEMDDPISRLDDSEKVILRNLLRKLGHTSESPVGGQTNQVPLTSRRRKEASTRTPVHVV